MYKGITVGAITTIGNKHVNRGTPCEDASYAVAKNGDIIIGMDAYNMADLKRLVYPADRTKLVKMLELVGQSRDVADPWYTGNFEDTYRDVLAGCRALTAEIRNFRQRRL